MFSSYEDFKAAYVDAFKSMMKYTIGQVGSRLYAEKMATMADAHPEWAERAESEVD